MLKLKDAIRTMKFKIGDKPHLQLYTTWGEKLDPNHVLEEYPRPQLRRNNYTILNGYWDYCITKDAEIPELYDGEILVPFSPESILSGVNKQLKPGEFLWYKTTFKIKRFPENKRCILHFGAVDQFCEVYINNRKIKEHMGGYLPFSIDLTYELLKGENTLILKVSDDSDTSYHSRGKQKLDRGGMFYTAQSGIWQTVWMEWVPNIYIESIKITPLVLQSTVEVSIQLNIDNISDICMGDRNPSRSNYESTNSECLNSEIMNSESMSSESMNYESMNYESISSESINSKSLTSTEYHIDVYARGTLIQSEESKYPNVIIPMRNFEYWSPENPFLYDMVITVGEDCVESYFAMRIVEINTDSDGIPRIYLNHRPYFQNGILDQGYWPDGLYTAPSDEALVFDIQNAKELGFNMIRKHIKIESLRWYYHCDRLGVLVWQDMVNGGEKYNPLIVGYLPTVLPSLAKILKDKHYSLFGRKNEEGRKEWMKECEETVMHLYNCPSVVVWVPFNEAWGQFDVKKVYETIKEIDNTRLVDHASGWYDQKYGDFKSIHNYFHTLKVKTEKRPVVFSEFGGFACYINEHSYSKEIYGYRIYINEDELNKDFQKIYIHNISELKKKGLCAAVYTQISDVEDEVNGLFTYDRKICKVKPLADMNKL